MLQIDGDNISISKGDTATITLGFENTVPTGTIARLSLKRNYKVDRNVLWNIDKTITLGDGQVVFDIPSSKTSYQPGVYFWDVRFIYTTGEVVTPMNPAKFIILEVVGNASS